MWCIAKYNRVYYIMLARATDLIIAKAVVFIYFSYRNGIQGATDYGCSRTEFLYKCYLPGCEWS